MFICTYSVFSLLVELIDHILYGNVDHFFFFLFFFKNDSLATIWWTTFSPEFATQHQSTWVYLVHAPLSGMQMDTVVLEGQSPAKVGRCSDLECKQENQVRWTLVLQISYPALIWMVCTSENLYIPSQFPTTKNLMHLLRSILLILTQIKIYSCVFSNHFILVKVVANLQFIPGTLGKGRNTSTQSQDTMFIHTWGNLESSIHWLACFWEGKGKPGEHIKLHPNSNPHSGLN